MWLKSPNPLPSTAEFKKAYASLSLNVKFFVAICTLVGTLTTIGTVWFINQAFMVSVKSSTGEITEGIIGTPRFGNPLLATSDADRDLTALIYSGLMRKTSSGELIPDLAEKFEMSADGKTYTFHLKPNLSWHDGENLTAKDVVFTIDKIKDPVTKSNRKARFEGVTAEAKDDLTVVFHLEKPFAGFLKNTTLGIMPEHLWSEVPTGEFSFSDLNISPIGSGPYYIDDVKKDSAGVPEYYLLKPFKRFALGAPKITIHLKMYPNETARLDAFESGSIDTISAISPENLALVSTKNHKVVTAPMPRVFAIFFNQNQSPVLAKSEVRKALSAAVDKQSLVDKILLGYGSPINGPTLFDLVETKGDFDLAKAQAILEDAGWEKDEAGIYEKTDKKTTVKLEFSLATSDTPELKQVAEQAVATWTKLGAKVDLKIFESGSLEQTVIRPRKYDALLFGQVTGADADLYPFWHSSQRIDPGLNVALYANVTTDKLIDEMKDISDTADRREKIDQIRELIKDDYPAIFLYTPKFIYVIPEQIKDIDFGIIEQPSDRFADLYQAYIKIDKVWSIFAKENNIIKD